MSPIINHSIPLFFTLLVLIPSSVHSECCLSSSSFANPNSNSKFAFTLQGKSSSFFINNKRFDIKALFPSSYSIPIIPSSPYPLSICNCTKGMGPDNNPNFFSCSFTTDNPSYPYSFGVQWELTLPPSSTNPLSPIHPTPEPISLSINGEFDCLRVDSIDKCIDPTNLTTSSTSSPPNLNTLISLGPIGTLPFWLVIVVAIIIAFMFIGFLYICYRQRRGNPERPNRDNSPISTLPNSKDPHNHPSDPNWWRRHLSSKRNDSAIVSVPINSSSHIAISSQSTLIKSNLSSVSAQHAPTSINKPNNNLHHSPVHQVRDHDSTHSISTASDTPLANTSSKPVHIINLDLPRLHSRSLSQSSDIPLATLSELSYSQLTQSIKSELQIPAHSGCRQSYNRTELVVPLGPANTSPDPTLSLSPPCSDSSSRPEPPNSAAVVTSTMTTRPTLGISTDTSEVSPNNLDPQYLSVMGIKPNSPSKNDRIRNWTSSIPVVVKNGSNGSTSFNSSSPGDSEDEQPLGVTIGRRTSQLHGNVKSGKPQVVAAGSDSEDDETPIAITLARPSGLASSRTAVDDVIEAYNT